MFDELKILMDSGPLMSGIHIMRMRIVLEVEPTPPQSDPAAVKASGWCQHWATN